MITLPEPAAGALGSFLASDMKDRFGSSHARLAELIPFAARLVLECIGNSDALYHNVMLVTLAGHDIFKGRALLKPSTPTDYSNFIVPAWRMVLLFVPSVVVPIANVPDRNVLINHRAEQAASITIVDITPFTLDPRLFKP
jgi:hypothetical protein